MDNNLISPILISLLLIQTAFYTNAQDFKLSHICINTTQTHTKGTHFNTNLNKLLTQVINKTPKPGFWSGSSGPDDDAVFGMGLCRGDVSPKDCRACLSNAKGNITSDCPTRAAAAIIWYDFCLLKYSNHNFFGQVDTENKFQLWNTANAADPVGFNSTAVGLLRNLSKCASDNGKMFKGGEASFGNTTTIYGIAQCSRDVSRGDCSRCLEYAVNELPGIVVSENRKLISIPQGGRTLTGSCNVGYEIYPFLSKYD